MAETIDMRKVKWEISKRKLIESATEKVNQFSNWVKGNQATLKLVVPATLVGVKGSAKIARSMARSNAVRREMKDRHTRFYDHSLGMYWRTKRELTADELRTVERRKRAGESYGDIFESMKLLK